MKPVLFICAMLPVMAQEPPPPPAATPPASAESTVPATESWLTGTIDLGYRWGTGVAGSFDTYRSIVNLGSGPKLLGADFTMIDPHRRAFDRLDVRAFGWGGEPYSTLHVSARKTKLYDFNGDYRDLAYFNFLPSFADPLLARGLILNQQSFDLRRSAGSFQLDLLPGSRVVPYVAYDFDSGSGSGAATFVTGGNEYAVPNSLRDLTHLYRGGARIELRHIHATVEQGGSTFKDDQSLYQNGGANPGFVTAPVLGQTMSLDRLLSASGVRGTSIYTKALLTASPTPWLDLYGQFLFSQPDNTVNFQQTAAGNFFLPSQLLLFTNQQFLLSAQSTMPHTTGSAGVEIRPVRNVRILESWMTDRLHNSGAAASDQLLARAGLSQTSAAQLASSLFTNYNQSETDVIWDVHPWVSLRGGYRRVWGEAAIVTLPAAGLASADAGTLRRDIAIGGFTFRPGRKLSVTGEAEGSPDHDPTYFRSGRHEYEKARGQVRYQAATDLRITADFTILNNQNPAQGVNYDYRVKQESMSFLWSPAGSKRFDVQASYSRSDLHSRIVFLSPQDLLPQESRYREGGHTATALVTLNLPHTGVIAPRITAGGSLIIFSGSRATGYYQPAAKLWLPLGKYVEWFGEWRYYGYGEASYQYEAFRTHLITAGVRIKK